MNNLLNNKENYLTTKKEILSTYGVTNSESFQVKAAIRKRINFLKQYLVLTNRTSYVLGISGGVDSTAAGKLCQLACNELKTEGYHADFIAMRLPAGIQKDEADAQEAIDFIQPDKTLTVNIGNAALEMSLLGLTEFHKIGGSTTAEDIDFNKGNIKARMRMIAVFHQAALNDGLVIGTNNNCEIISGFFTKFADNAVDLNILNGLNKRQVKLIAKELGASEKLWNKIPTADLEELTPGKTDEDSLGFSYDDIDDFLEGKDINNEIEQKIVLQYYASQHKRNSTPQFK